MDDERERRSRQGAAYAVAAVAAAVAVAGAVRGILVPEQPSAALIFAVAASSVAVVLATTAGRLALTPSARVLAAAPLVGLLLSGAAHLAIILALSLVFAPAQELVDVVIGARLLDDVDARLLVVLLVTASVLAPVTEEPAKAVAATFARPTGRRGAFLAGATAGAGFSVVEHALYALPAAEYGDVWVEVLLLRSVSAAMHPLATGLVYLGWWEYRRTGARRAVVRGLLLGVGLHAAWNTTAIVMEGVAGAAGEGRVPGALETAGLLYAGAIGIAIALFLWRTIAAVAREEPAAAPGAPDGPFLGWSSDRRAWGALGAALVVPVALLIVVLPRLG